MHQHQHQHQHLRRALSVLLATFVLLVVPQVAQAAFTGRAAPQMSVGTASMSEPTSLVGTFGCSYSRNNRNVTGITVDVDGFEDSGPSGSTYEYRLAYQGFTLDSERTTSKSATLRYSDNDGVRRPATVVLTIRATYRNWTGPYLSRDISC